MVALDAHISMAKAKQTALIVATRAIMTANTTKKKKKKSQTNNFAIKVW